MLVYIKHLCLILFSTVFLSLYAAEIIPASISMQGNKIVTGSGVRMRAMVALDAKVVTKLALGSIVKAMKRTRKKVRIGSVTGYWYYVSNEQGTKKGWVFGALLADFKASKKEATHWKLVQQRSVKKQASFADQVALYDYISRLLPTIKSTKIRALLSLEQLLTLQRTAEKITYDKAQVTPYSLFLAKHKNSLFHDEVSARYLVPNKRYWALAKRYNKSSAGDKLTWFAANAAVGGECEGEIECTFVAMERQEGTYLQRYPNGHYAKAALLKVSKTLTYIIDVLTHQKNEYPPSFSDMKTEHKRLLKGLKKGKSVSKLRKKVIKQLQKLPILMKAK